MDGGGSESLRSTQGTEITAAGPWPTQTALWTMEGTPERTPEGTPEGTPKWASEGTSERTHEGTSERTPEGAVVASMSSSSFNQSEHCGKASVENSILRSGWTQVQSLSGVPSGPVPGSRTKEDMLLMRQTSVLLLREVGLDTPLGSLTLLVEVEVLQALVQVAGGGCSPDVGVGVDGAEAWNRWAVPHRRDVSRLCINTHLKSP